MIWSFLWPLTDLTIQGNIQCWSWLGIRCNLPNRWRYPFVVSFQSHFSIEVLFTDCKRQFHLSFSLSSSAMVQPNVVAVLSMERHSGQKCNLIAPCIPLDRTRVPLDRTSIPLDRIFLPFDRTSISLDRIFLPLDRTSIPLDRAFLPFDRTSIILLLTVLQWFIPVAFHILPYFCGNSIPSDHNYRSAVVTIWSAVKRGRLNLDFMFVWRHTTYDYMTYYSKSSRTCGKMAQRKANISPHLNWWSILADVLNKLECGDVDHWLC